MIRSKTGGQASLLAMPPETAKMLVDIQVKSI